MRASGIMSKATHEKITMRHLESAAPIVEATLTGPEIRALR
jgi:hypothetical protein